MNVRTANGFEQMDDADELSLDRLPGMPMLGILAGTILSLACWGAIALIAWRIVG